MGIIKALSVCVSIVLFLYVCVCCLLSFVEERQMKDNKCEECQTQILEPKR